MLTDYKMALKSKRSNTSQVNGSQQKVHIENQLNEYMETFSKYLTLSIIGYCLITIPHVRRFKSEWVDSYGLDNDYSSLLFIIPGFILSLSSYFISTKLLSPMFKGQYDPARKRSYETNEERVKRMGNYIHGIIYYSFEVIILFAVLYKTNYFPISLGGSLDILKTYESYPQEAFKLLRMIYMFELGHHIESALTDQLTGRNSKSRWTMALHAVITITLILYSYFLKHYYFGIPIMITHDINDIFLNVGRFCREFRPFQGLQYKINVLMLFLSWGYTRLYTYLSEIFVPLMKLLVGKFHKHFYSQIFFIIALNLLLVLNLFWFFQIYRIVYSTFVKKDEVLPFEDNKITKHDKNK